MSMVNRLLFASLVVLVGSAASAADGGLDGNYKLVYLSGASEVPLALIKLETKDGKLEGTLLSGAPIGAQKIKKVSMNGKIVLIDVDGGRQSSFEGVVGGEVIPGSFQIGSNLLTAKLVKTTDEKLEPGQRPTPLKVPELLEAVALENKLRQLKFRAQRESDKEKKEELKKEAAEAAAKAATETPKLYRQVLKNHSDSPVVLVAGYALLRNLDAKPTPEEGRSWVAAVSQVAEKHGPRLANDTRIQLAEILTANPELKELALELANKAQSSLGSSATTEEIVRVKKILLPALKANGKSQDAKGVEEQLAKLETILDNEYTKNVPPFKPEKFAGRKEKGDRKIVMELFTGAQCPPCVAADVAFDALSKAYQPSELILLQYHLHIPGPDPMTNADTEGRAKFYNVNSTPSTLFNGKAAAGGGGGMANSESKFKQYEAVINKGLESTSEAKLQLTANKVGNKIDIKAEVSGIKDPDEKKRLRLVLVEESIRYVGGNKLRFHHHVVRALPGGVEGFALKEANSQHAASVNLDELRAQLIKYLDNYAKEMQPFPYADRPLDFKHLKVVGLIQNDETKEIVQVVEVDVSGEATTRLDTHK